MMAASASAALFSASGFALRGIAFGPVGKTAPVCDTSFESDLSSGLLRNQLFHERCHLRVWNESDASSLALVAHPNQCPITAFLALVVIRPRETKMRVSFARSRQAKCYGRNRGQTIQVRTIVCRG